MEVEESQPEREEPNCDGGAKEDEGSILKKLAMLEAVDDDEEQNPQSSRPKVQEENKNILTDMVKDQ